MPSPAVHRLPSRARLLAALALAAALLAAGVPPVAAQVPVTDAAHIALNAFWHYEHYLQFGWQIYQQYEQLLNQVRQIDAQLRALAKLRDPNWRDIQSLLTELDFLMRSGTSLGYPLPDAGGQYRQLYPGYSPWSDPGASIRQSERALDTFRAGLDATSSQAQSFAPGEELLARIRQQMATTDGHQQALEQIATLAAFSAQEQLLTRQALAVANNQAALAHGYWIDRQAQGDATWTWTLVETSLAASRNSSPGWTFRPSWLQP